MRECIGTDNCHQHQEHIRSRIHDPRPVARRTELPALLDDAVKLTRSTPHEIAPARGVRDDGRRYPERTERAANETTEVALSGNGERRGHETEQDEPDAEHHRAAESLPVACQPGRAVVPDDRECEMPDTDCHEVQRNSGKTLAETGESTRGSRVAHRSASVPDRE